MNTQVRFSNVSVTSLEVAHRYGFIRTVTVPSNTTLSPAPKLAQIEAVTIYDFFQSEIGNAPDPSIRLQNIVVQTELRYQALMCEQP